LAPLDPGVNPPRWQTGFGVPGKTKKGKFLRSTPRPLAILPELSRFLGTSANLVVLLEFLFHMSFVV
jgi:hypothetical protein